MSTRTRTRALAATVVALVSLAGLAGTASAAPPPYEPDPGSTGALSYLEAARFSWWRNVFGADGFTANGFIVARIEIDYRRAALPADRLIVRLKIDTIGTSSFAITYEIANARTRPMRANTAPSTAFSPVTVGVPSRTR